MLSRFLGLFRVAGDMARSGRRRAVRSLKNLPLNQQLILSGIVVGAAGGISAFVLNRIIHACRALVTHVFAVVPPDFYIAVFVLLPTIGGLVAGWLTHVYCPDAKGHGVMEVVRAIRERDGHIASRVVWAKSLASGATIGSGGAAGTEGPIVQIGAAAGSWIGRILDVSRADLKMLAAAGAVGGLSASFSIPLAGVFFTMEVILRDFANEAFSSVVIASVTGTVTARLLLGDEAFISPLNYGWQSPADFLPYALLGLVCAPVGSLYMRCLAFFERRFGSEKRIPDWLKPAVGGFLLGTLALTMPDVLGTGEETVNSVLEGSYAAGGGALLLLAAGKILATSLTLGSGGSLMPSLFIGAMTGGAWGHFLNLIPGFDGEPGAFAVVGMACVFTSAYTAPVTAIVMAFEMTKDYGILPPVMFACVITGIFAKKRSVTSPIERGNADQAEG